MLIINNKRDLFIILSNFLLKILIFSVKYLNMLYFYNTFFLIYTENEQINKIV